MLISKKNLIEFLKTKVKSHGNEVSDFQDKKIPKVDYSYTCLAVITLDSALKKDENYYAQVTAQKLKFSIKDFFSKCDQILRKLRI